MEKIKIVSFRVKKDKTEKVSTKEKKIFPVEKPKKKPECNLTKDY